MIYKELSKKFAFCTDGSVKSLELVFKQLQRTQSDPAFFRIGLN